MKIFGHHVYRTGSDGTPITRRQTSDGGGVPAPDSTAAPATAETEPARHLRAQQSRNQRWKFGFTIMKEKYRPAARTETLSLPLPDLTGVSDFSDLLDMFSEKQARATSTADATALSKSRPGPKLRSVVEGIDSSARLKPPATFMGMPTEVRQHIANLLPVGDIKRFRQVSKHASGLGARAIQHVKVADLSSLKSALQRFTDGGIRSLTLCGNFSDHHFLNRELQNLMNSTLAALEIFDVSDCSDLSPVGISNAVRHMPNLRELKMSGRKVTEAIAQYFGGSLPEEMLDPARFLKRLTLSGPNMLTSAQLAQGLTYVPALTHLNLTNLDQLNGATLGAVLSNMPQLTHLSVDDCEQLTVPELIEALSRVRNLQYLRLPNTIEIEDNELAQILEQTPQLTHLVLSNCSALSSDGLATALEHVGNTLLCLDLVEADPQLANALVQVPNLEQLKLKEIDHLDDARLAASLSRVPNLKHLELSGMEEITDAGLTTALQYVSKLTHLDVNACNELQHINLPRLELLKTLNIPNNANLQSVMLDKLPSLQNLNINNNQLLDKATMMESLQHVRATLATLDMSNLSELRDDEMPNLSGFKNLRTLDLSNNHLITDAALESLPLLDRLYVTQCHELSDAALKAVKALESIQYWDMPSVRGA